MIATSNFDELPRGHYGVIYADPPWHWKPWREYARNPDSHDAAFAGDRAVEKHYGTMTMEEIAAMPVSQLAAADCVLFLWVTWPLLMRVNPIIEAWGFEYKTCGFDWMKADVSTLDLFPDAKTAEMKLGFWTRSNTEPCLLATRGSPKRLDAGVRMGIIEPARQHSRKPDCVHQRIQRLVAGPYLELFGRRRVPGWDVFGNQIDRFRGVAADAGVDP